MVARFFRRGSPAAWLLAALLPLSACDIFGGDDEPPLPGERIPVLTQEQALAASSELRDVPVVLPRPYVNDNWPQVGGSPTHASYHLALAPDPQIIWRRDVGSGTSDSQPLLAQPVVASGVVFTLDSDTQVTAVSIQTGDVLWESELDPGDEDDGFFGGGLAVAGNRLFATTGYGAIYALSTENGEVVWEARIDAPIRASPTVYEGRVFVISLDNSTTAFSAADGSVLWEHNGIQEIASFLGGASPAVADKVVIVPYSSGEVFALRTNNGRQIWSDSLTAIAVAARSAELAHIRAQPVVDRDLVFAVSLAGRMAAIDLRRGLRLWEADIGGAEMPWAAGPFLFAITEDSQLVALDRRSGRIRWVVRLQRYEDEEDQEDPLIWVGPLLAGDRLIVGSSEGRVEAYSPYDGAYLGEIEVSGGVAVAPIIAEETLLLLTDNAELIALR